MSSECLNVFKPNEHTEDYHIRKLNNESFLVEIEDKHYIYVGEKLISFETNDIIKKFFQNMALTTLKSHLLTVKKIFTLCYLKSLILIKDKKIQQKMMSISNIIK